MSGVTGRRQLLGRTYYWLRCWAILLSDHEEGRNRRRSTGHSGVQYKLGQSTYLRIYRRIRT